MRKATKAATCGGLGLEYEVKSSSQNAKSRKQCIRVHLISKRPPPASTLDHPDVLIVFVEVEDLRHKLQCDMVIFCWQTCDKDYNDRLKYSCATIKFGLGRVWHTSRTLFTGEGVSVETENSTHLWNDFPNGGTLSVQQCRPMPEYVRGKNFVPTNRVETR